MMLFDSLWFTDKYWNVFVCLCMALSIVYWQILTEFMIHPTLCSNVPERQSGWQLAKWDERKCIVLYKCRQAEEKLVGLCFFCSLFFCSLLADWQTLAGPLLPNGAQHVRHELLQAEGGCPAPVPLSIGVIEPHWPAVCCKGTSQMRCSE